MRRVVFALGVVAIGAAVLLPGAMGGSAATPGVTSKIVTIGGTFPFSGPASSYAPIPVGMQAYFSYVNAKKTNGKRGVFGRLAQRQAVGGGHLARQPQHGQAVGPVRGDLEIDDGVVALAVDPLHRKAAYREPYGDVGRRSRHVHELLQPGEEHLHSGNCSRKRRSFS